MLASRASALALAIVLLAAVPLARGRHLSQFDFGGFGSGQQQSKGLLFDTSKSDQLKDKVHQGKGKVQQIAMAPQYVITQQPRYVVAALPQPAPQPVVAALPQQQAAPEVQYVPTPVPVPVPVPVPKPFPVLKPVIVKVPILITKEKNHPNSLLLGKAVAAFAKAITCAEDFEPCDDQESVAPAGSPAPVSPMATVPADMLPAGMPVPSAPANEVFGTPGLAIPAPTPSPTPEPTPAPEPTAPGPAPSVTSESFTLSPLPAQPTAPATTSTPVPTAPAAAISAGPMPTGTANAIIAAQPNTVVASGAATQPSQTQPAAAVPTFQQMQVVSIQNQVNSQGFTTGQVYAVAPASTRVVAQAAGR